MRSVIDPHYSINGVKRVTNLVRAWYGEGIEQVWSKPCSGGAALHFLTKMQHNFPLFKKNGQPLRSPIPLSE